MGFIVGKSYAEPSLKLHLLRLQMQPLYQDVENFWFGVVNSAKDNVSVIHIL